MSLRLVNVTAAPAPDEKAAAAYYPAGYWYSLLRVHFQLRPDPLAK